MDIPSFISYILQVKEMIALLALLWFCWFLLAKHLPFLLSRSDDRAEREAVRHESNRVVMERAIEKLDDTMRAGLNQLKDALVEIARQSHAQFNDKNKN